MQQSPIITQSEGTPQPAPSAPQPPQEKRHKDGWKGAASTIALLIAAPLVAIVITSFVFQSYEVDGPSMENTLQNQDRLIVWKVPRSIARLTKKEYTPPRGEIIVFVKRGIADFGEPEDKQLIKRVIGLPGERVVVRDGKITVYNKEHPDGFNPDELGLYKIQGQMTGGSVDVVVPEGEIFVAGDNRPNSLDSRAFGTISSSDVVGDLAIRIFPFNKAKSF